MNFKEYVKVNPFRFVVFALSTFLMAVIIIGMCYFTQLVADIVLTRNWRSFLIILILDGICGILAYALQGLALYSNTIQEQELNDKVRQQLVQNYYNDGKMHKVSEMQNRLTNDLQLINNSYYEMLFNLIYGIGLVISTIVYLILLNWQLLLAILILVAITLFLPKLTEKPLQKATEFISDSNKVYLDSLNDWLSGLDQIRQFLAGAKLFSVTENASKKLEDATVKQTTYTQLLKAVNGIVTAIFGLLLFILTGYLIVNGQASIGVLLIIGNFRFYLNQGIQLITVSRGQMKGTEKLINEVDQELVPVSSKQKLDLATPTAFSTQDLQLQFPNGEKLTYPDLQVKTGEKILLTGDSGAGKSTLFKLILGELKPSSGEVDFQDKNGKTIIPDLSKIGYIPQDPVVFPASIKDNITMFNKKLDSKVNDVISSVNFSDDIAKFKDGVNEQLNLDKLNISGGQRQKIVLARAKIHNSEIILIDEGTSAIDQKATMNILHNLVKTPATIVFIAHNFNEEMRQLFDREIHLVKN
ncbi:ABC transporter ATP-binding protein [uncultured Lactobacillus sp.]|uniref:ABC transporter ATP-binding protein n=1 Tax=uncultured Lactobacillus sp. TaxID=153152 RepID=UPI0028047C94|nr:ABC transporter ATP-binding protein [uncultured Lactobacillus sp.]